MKQRYTFWKEYFHWFLWPLICYLLYLLDFFFLFSGKMHADLLINIGFGAGFKVQMHWFWAYVKTSFPDTHHGHLQMLEVKSWEAAGGTVGSECSVSGDLLLGWGRAATAGIATPVCPRAEVPLPGNSVMWKRSCNWGKKVKIKDAWEMLLVNQHCSECVIWWT